MTGLYCARFPSCMVQGDSATVPECDLPDCPGRRSVELVRQFVEPTHASMIAGIGWAVRVMKQGGKVRRRGWNGKGMYCALERDEQRYLPFVYMKTAQGQLIPWLCSQADLLADDWEIATP